MFPGLVYQVLLFFVSVCVSPGDCRLSLWISGDQVDAFIGVPMDIYIIQGSVIVPFLQSPYRRQPQLPVIPADIARVHLSWFTEGETFYYHFSDLRSLDPAVLYDPMLSITSQGVVPQEKSTFHMAIPCTERTNGIASIIVILHIRDGKLRPIRGSPLRLHLRKQCVKDQSLIKCPMSCKNGGNCGRDGVCICSDGYMGPFCETALCNPPCTNNGTCVAPSVCKCQNGFTGTYCEKGGCGTVCQYGGTCLQLNRCNCLKREDAVRCSKETCRRSCSHGICISTDRCRCYIGWHGRSCTKRIQKNAGRRKRRKLDRYIRMLRHKHRRQKHKLNDRRKHSPEFVPENRAGPIS